MAGTALDWSEIDRSILGKLFERDSGPGNRSQLGADCTGRGNIMLIVDPVVVRPWLDAWSDVKDSIVADTSRADKSVFVNARSRYMNPAERGVREFLDRLRSVEVPDPACGSGKLQYQALQAL